MHYKVTIQTAPERLPVILEALAAIGVYTKP